MRLKPGSATRPFCDAVPAIVDNEGHVLEGECEGNLAITRPWPGPMRTVYGDHQRFIDTRFKTFPGFYFSGDGARRDADGYYWTPTALTTCSTSPTMRTAEIESALVLHENVAEAAVVGYPHDIKGQGIYAYVTVVKGVEPSDPLRKELVTAKVSACWWSDEPDGRPRAAVLRTTRAKIARAELVPLRLAATQAGEAVGTRPLDHLLQDLPQLLLLR